jgi:methionine biosynthesis protein MetW
MQTDAALEELSKKIPSYLMALDGLLQDGSKVLFVRQTSLALLKRFRDRGIDVSVIDRNLNNAAIYQKHNITAHPGDAYSQITKFGRDSFDYIVFDNSLTTFADVQAVMTASAIVSEHIIVIVDNLGYWKNRINFLLNGSFSRTDYTDWYTTKHLRSCCIKDFMSFCSNTNLIIERACYFDSKGMINNLYDIRKIPSLFGEKLLFITGHRDNYMSIPVL